MQDEIENQQPVVTHVTGLEAEEFDDTPEPFYSYLPDIIGKLATLAWPFVTGFIMFTAVTQYRSCDVAKHHDTALVQVEYAKTSRGTAEAKLRDRTARAEAYSKCINKVETYGCIDSRKCYDMFYGEEGKKEE